MMVFILSLGTKGDLEAFLVLGRELTRRGYRVLVGTSGFYATRVRSAGLEWVPVGSGTETQMQDALDAMARATGPRAKSVEFIRRWIQPQLRQALPQIMRDAAAADYFVSNLKMAIYRRGSVIPGAFVTYDLPETVGDLRRHTSRKYGGRIIDLVALSRQLADPDRCWGDEFHFTGFWLDPAPPLWNPPRTLVEFLDGGSPPVVVTLGSMRTSDEPKLARSIIAALRRARCRGILLGSLGAAARGWDLGENLCIETHVPYDWLFSRALCVIHHGGIGTVASAIAAGVPSILLPQILAQHLLANALSAAELTAGVFASDGLDESALASGISQSRTSPSLRASVRSWQSAVLADRGVAHAVDLIAGHWESLRDGKRNSGSSP